MGWFAGVDRNLTTFLEGDRLAVRPLHRLTVGGALHLTGECVGHPGCVKSVDCVHIVWDKCPSGFFSSCKSKEKLIGTKYEATFP